MDLNALIHREGVERLRAIAAGCIASRDAHLGLADLYRDRIDIRRRATLTAAGLGPGVRAPRL
ncbi:MAG TPA: hypothetical protein VEC11_06215 [Allosphingosinicella sp.]|nr:hypothetical protein [Allosphingosinicella sp.]